MNLFRQQRVLFLLAFAFLETHAKHQQVLQSSLSFPDGADTESIVETLYDGGYLKRSNLVAKGGVAMAEALYSNGDLRPIFTPGYPGAYSEMYDALRKAIDRRQDQTGATPMLKFFDYKEPEPAASSSAIVPSIPASNYAWAAAGCSDPSNCTPQTSAAWLARMEKLRTKWTGHPDYCKNVLKRFREAEEENRAHQDFTLGFEESARLWNVEETGFTDWVLPGDPPQNDPAKCKIFFDAMTNWRIGIDGGEDGSAPFVPFNHHYDPENTLTVNEGKEAHHYWKEEGMDQDWKRTGAQLADAGFTVAKLSWVQTYRAIKGKNLPERQQRLDLLRKPNFNRLPFIHELMEPLSPE